MTIADDYWLWRGLDICIWRRGKRTSVSIRHQGGPPGFPQIYSSSFSSSSALPSAAFLSQEKYEKERFCNNLGDSGTVVLVGMHWPFPSLQTGVQLKLLRWRKKRLKPLAFRHKLIKFAKLRRCVLRQVCYGSKKFRPNFFLSFLGNFLVNNLLDQHPLYLDQMFWPPPG